MSQLEFAPRFGAKDFTIGAHADHKTSDYFFPRVQSLEMRATPWERRLRPQYSWMQLGGYAAMLLVATSVSLAFI